MPKNDHENENEHECGCEHEHEHDLGDEFEGEIPMTMELEAASQVLLEMREQNVELIKIAAQVAGYAGTHGPLKPGEVRQAMNSIWDIYSQLYQWIDPEDSEDEDEEDEGEE